MIDNDLTELHLHDQVCRVGFAIEYTNALNSYWENMDNLIF